MKKILFVLIAILGIVACETEPEITVQQTLSLSVDNAKIYADGMQTATFTVKDDQGAVVDDAIIYYATTNEALEGYTFKTKYAGEYKFYAKKGDTISNEISIVAQEFVPEQTKVVTLTVSPETIVADGVQEATFSVMCNSEAVDAAIYYANDNTPLDGNIFTTTAPGEYKFYAMYEEIKSNEVVVVAEAEPVKEEKPITLNASKLTILANGMDSATLTVTQEDADVTSESAIYVNGGALNGNVFSTITAGDYTIYATKGTQKSNEITITAEYVEGGTSVVFVDGVTLTSGWYDVNKKGAGDTNGDMPLCWAASASNILQWWQDRYVAAGNTLPEGAFNGPGEIYELSIFENTFWNPDMWTIDGGHPNVGVIWYLEGSNLNAGGSSGAQPKAEGGYFKSVWDDLYTNTYHDYTNGITGEYNNYYLWGKGSGLTTDYDILKKFTEYVVEFINRGPVGMAVYPGGNAGFHTVTIWGYEIDNATGLLSRIWLTDDGDQKRDPKVQTLNEYTVDVSTIQVYTSKFRLPHFTNTDGTVWYGQSWAATLYPVAGYGTNN